MNGVDLEQATHDRAVEVIKMASSPVAFVVQSLQEETSADQGARLYNTCNIERRIVVCCEAAFP